MRLRLWLPSIAVLLVLVACSTSPTPTPTVAPLFEGVTFELIVSEVPPGMPDYDRGDWPHWRDADSDCQNTRAEVLIEESFTAVTFDGCRVIGGDWLGLYTGARFVEASDLDVDHMVPLANAHRSGAWAWDTPTKQAYANYLGDPDHLIAVSAAANRSKGDKGPEEWRPPDASYWCEYATDWSRIKDAWALAATSAELTALRDMLATCTLAVRIVVVDDPGPLPEVEVTPTPTEPFVDRNCGDFGTWQDAQAFFEAEGGPEDDPHRLDNDGDGIACASLPGAP